MQQPSIRQPKKYILLNGIMTLNQDFSTTTTTTTSESIFPKRLEIISSIEDFNQIQVEEGSSSTLSSIPPSVQNGIQHMETVGLLEDDLLKYFSKLQIPIGMISKLIALKIYRLRFNVSDSTSMKTKKSQTTYGDAPKYIRKNNLSTLYMTRLEEAQCRLHVLVDILAFLTTHSIQIHFTNSEQIIELSKQGRTPKEFQEYAHNLITDVFETVQNVPHIGNIRGLISTMERSFADSEEHENNPTIHYFFTDGIVGDGDVKQAKNVLINRHDPMTNPVLLLTCSNSNAECQWLKDVEDGSPYTAEIDDYFGEMEEVCTNQGAVFPYTKGLWLVSNLVAAINTDDLDALDEKIPLTKHTLDDLLGRYHTDVEYELYFNSNPYAQNYKDMYTRFLTEDCAASKLVSEQEKTERVEKCNIM